MAKLTKKQQIFCDKYIETLNASQAAIYAGYSEKTARQTGYENLTKPYIQEYIQKRMKSKDKALIMDQDEVLQRITMLGRSAENENVKLKALETMAKRYALLTEKTINENNHNINMLDDWLKAVKDD